MVCREEKVRIFVMSSESRKDYWKRKGYKIVHICRGGRVTAWDRCIYEKKGISGLDGGRR